MSKSHSLKDELLSALSKDAFFGILPESSRNALSSKMSVREYKVGQNVYGFDDTPVGLYFLFDGCLRVEWPGLFEVKAAHLYTPGSWFGQLSSMTETKRLVTVTSVTFAKIGFLPLNDLKILMEVDNEIVRHLSRITQARLRTAIDAVADLMIRDPEQRFIATIIRLSGINNPNYKPSAFEIFFSQEEVGLMANMARTSASTILKRLERLQLLKTGYRRLEITNPQGLKDRLEQLTGLRRR